MQNEKVAVLQIHSGENPTVASEVAEWLREQADFIEAHKGELSKHFKATLFSE